MTSCPSHRPPLPRNVGTPLSAEMPAPVRTRTLVSGPSVGRAEADIPLWNDAIVDDANFAVRLVQNGVPIIVARVAQLPPSHGTLMGHAHSPCSVPPLHQPAPTCWS